MGKCSKIIVVGATLSNFSYYSWARLDGSSIRGRHHFHQETRELSTDLADITETDALYFATIGSSNKYSHKNEISASDANKPIAISDSVSLDASIRTCAEYCFESDNCQWFLLEKQEVRSSEQFICHLWSDVTIVSAVATATDPVGIYGYLKTTNSDHLNKVAECKDTFEIPGLKSSPEFCRTKDNNREISYYYEPSADSDGVVCARVPLTIYRAFYNDYFTDNMLEALAHPDSSRRLRSEKKIIPIQYAKKLSPIELTMDKFADLINSEGQKEYNVPAGGGTMWKYRFDAYGRVISVAGNMSAENKRPPKVEDEEEEEKEEEVEVEENDGDNEKYEFTLEQNQNKLPLQARNKRKERPEKIYQEKFNAIQKDARRKYNRGSADSAGHIVGYQFYCPNGFWNFVVQSPVSNSGGCWHQSETWLRTILDFGCKGETTMSMEYLKDVHEYKQELQSTYTSSGTDLFALNDFINIYNDAVENIAGKECGLFYRPVIMNLKIKLEEATTGTHCSKAWNGMQSSTSEGQEYFDVKNGIVYMNRALASWSNGPDTKNKVLKFTNLLGYATTSSGQCFNEMGNRFDNIQFTNDFKQVFLQAGRTNKCLATISDTSTLSLVDCTSNDAGLFTSGTNGEISDNMRFQYNIETVGPNESKGNSRDDYLSGCLQVNSQWITVENNKIYHTENESDCTTFRTTYDP